MGSTIISRRPVAAESCNFRSLSPKAAFRGLFALFLWLVTFHAGAAAYSLSPGGPLPSGCSSSSATSYNCSNLALAWNDSLSVANANTTLTVSGTFTPNGNTINWSSPATGFRINANAISGTQTLHLNGTLHVTNNLTLGSGQIIGNVSTNGSATVGGTITGTLTATGAVSTAWDTKITGAISGSTFTSGGGSTYGGGIAVTGGLTLAHNDTVTGNINAGTTASINGTVNGTLTAGGAVTSAWGTKVSGTLKGSTFSSGGGGTYSGGIETTTGGVTLGSNETVTGNVTAKGAVSLGSSTSISGNVTTTGTVSLGSGATVGGAVTTTGAVSLDSSATIGGNVTATGTVALGSSARVNGSISADGEVSLGHATRVGGDVTTSDKDGVTIASSDARVTGCVRVPKDGNKKNIVLGWHAVVGGVCCRPGNSAQCQDSCVKNDSGYAMPPLCTEMPPSANEPFGFNCVEPGSNALTGRIYTKLAGTSFSLNIAALKDENGDNTADSVETSYASDQDRTVTVELVDGNGEVSCASRTSLSTPVNLTFLKTAQVTEQGRKNVTLTSPNAYSNVMCRVKDASLGKTGCSTDRFSIRPKEFIVVAAPDANADPTGTDPAASPKIVAGVPFELTADTGVEGYNGKPTLSSQTAHFAAHTGASRVLAPSGDFSAAAAATGVATGSFTYGEVGYFKVKPSGVYDSTFTEVDQPDDCTDDFSITAVGGKFGCKFRNEGESKYFGRFIPSRFEIVPAGVTPACGSFSYFGQDGFATEFTLKAVNSGGARTENYEGVFARFDLGSATAYGFKVSTTTTLPAGATYKESSTAPESVSGWIKGEAAVKAKHWISKPTDRAGVTPVRIDAKPADADTVTTTARVNVSSSDTPLRYGRLQIGNAHGSELIALPVSLSAQYWDGTAWRPNTLDSCSPINPKAIVFSGWTGNLNACETSFPASGAVTLAGGRSSLSLSRPGAGNGGSVLLTLANKKPPDAPDNKTCSAGTEATILDADVTTPWFGSEDDDSKNPAGRVSFGTHKAPLIDRRERY